MESVLDARTRQRNVAFTVSTATDGDATVFSAPDYIQRITVFDLRYGGGVLSGRVLTDEERTAVTRAATLTLGPQTVVQIRVFPYASPSYALVRPPTSNLLTSPSGSLATQARCGEGVWLLEQSGAFTRVLMDVDGYIAWAPTADLIPVSDSAHQAWLQSATAMLNQPASGLDAATRLPPAASDTLLLPDQSTVPVPASVLLPQTDLLATAHQFLPGGLQPAGPYLFGGTAGRDYDCSGYTQTVFRLCGLWLPRDADEQQEYLVPVAPAIAQLDELRPNDLVFFSENGQYATHVGIYEGAGRIIHCSTGGAYPGVKESMLVGGDTYDQFLQSIYFGAGRLP
jgi:hypothetical protein